MGREEPTRGQGDWLGELGFCSFRFFLSVLPVPEIQSSCPTHMIYNRERLWGEMLEGKGEKGEVFHMPRQALVCHSPACSMFQGALPPHELFQPVKLRSMICHAFCSMPCSQKCLCQKHQNATLFILP